MSVKTRLRRIHVVVGVAVAALAASAAPALAAVQDTSPWAPTATGTAQLINATPLGAAPSSAAVPVTIALTGRNQGALDGLIAAQRNPKSNLFHRYLTPAAYAQEFGATTDQVNAVTRYLRSQGMTDISVAANNLAITANATAGTAQTAFHTTLRQFRSKGRTVLANTAPAEVPTSLSGIVDSVLGLNQATNVVKFVNRATPAVAGYSPTALATAYDANGLASAASMSIAVMAAGNVTQVPKDLATARSYFSQPAVPITIVPAPTAGSDTTNNDEWDMDTQASSGLAGNVKQLYLYDAPSLDDGNITTELALFASQDKAQVGSASFGICDSIAKADGSATAMDRYLAEAASQGQNFFASSGDEGSSCSTSATQSSTQTSFPASSPYAVGVGGTHLSVSGAGAYAGETVWNGDGGASGGGLSTTEPRPSYQARAVQSVNLTTSYRGVPDIAMDGDPQTGLQVVVNSQLGVIGGTSLSAPLAMGAWTRLEGVHADALGLADSDLYSLYNETYASPLTTGPTPGLHDVTSGSNGAYSAKVGYDLTTGLGTIDVGALNSALGSPAAQGDAGFYGSAGNLKLVKPIVGMAADPVTGGYWLVAADGGVFNYNAPFLGSAGNLKLTKPVVGMAATSDGKGYWLVAADGGIFNYGTAPFRGSAGNLKLTKPVVGMAADTKTNGYWLVASDGGIFAYNAPFDGSAGGLKLSQPVVGMSATADSGGYHMVAADGGIFNYGTAAFHGSAANLGLTQPAVGIAEDTKTGGYWIVTSGGNVINEDATFYGSAGGLNLTKPIVGTAATPDSGGYWLVASDGGIFNY